MKSILVLFNDNTVKQGFTTFQPRDHLLKNMKNKSAKKPSIKIPHPPKSPDWWKRDRETAANGENGANSRVSIRSNKPKISWDTIQSFLVEVVFASQAIDENSGSHVLVSFQDCVTELHSKLVRCRFSQFFGKEIESRKERVVQSTVNQIGPYLKGLRGWFPGRKFRNKT